MSNIITGDGNNNTLPGTAGDDDIYGYFGNDTLTGLGGNDTLYGGMGGDSLDGGNGVDTASYASSSAGVWVSLAGGGYGYFGEAQGDRLYNIENLTGSSFEDTLIGNEGVNGGF